MASIDVKVTLKGTLFGPNVSSIVEKQIVHEIIGAVEARTQRQGKGLGSQRNRISHERKGLELNIDTTKVRPRTKGTAWQRKNIGIIKAMAPRVGRKAAERIADELS